MADGARTSPGTLPELGTDWRLPTAYESSLIALLWNSIPEERRPIVPGRVRQADACGCIQFEGTIGDGRAPVVAEAAVPRRHPAFPLEITLSVRDGVTCWLEFGPHDGGSSLRPPVEDFRVIPQFESI